MKKILFFMAAAMAFGSCQQDKVVDEVANNLTEEGYLISATINNNASSRINLDGFKASWSEGDAITVFNELGDEKANCPFKALNSDKTAATFLSSMDPDLIFYAAYPASSSPVLSEDVDTMRYVLPSVYGVNDNSQNIPMYGEFDNNTQNIKFNYLTALLKVNIKGLPEGFNTIQFKAKSSISGIFKTAIPLTADPLKLDAKGSTEIRVTHADNQGDFYAPIPAGTYSELHVSALDAQNREIQIVTLMNKEFELGKLYTVNRTYAANLISEPAEFATGHSSKDKFVDGWTKHVSADQHAEIAMVDNGPSFLWGKSIQITHLDSDTWNHSIAFNFDNTTAKILPKMYKLSFKVKTGVKMGWKVVNLVDKTNTDSKDDSFEFILNGQGKSQVWQSANKNEDFVDAYVFVNFAQSGISGWGGSTTYKPTAGTTLMDHITVMFRNPNPGTGTTIISDVQLSEVVGTY